MVLADMAQPGSGQPITHVASERARAIDDRPPVYKPVDVEPLKKTAPEFTVTFTEDKNGLYINGRKFAADAPIITSARVCTYQHWRIVNQTGALHIFHIHLLHYLVYVENIVLLEY